MSKEVKKIILIVTAVVFFMILVFLSVRQRTVRTNDGTVIGNLAGNLYNKGLFCEYEDTVYFANAYDNFALYSMKSDESEIKKIKSSATSFLNADENYLYCYQSGSSDYEGLSVAGSIRGIYRLNKSGKQSKSILRTDVSMLLLYGNDLYFDNYNSDSFSTLMTCRIDGSGEKTLCDYPLTPACVNNGSIYLAGTKKDHYLYTLNRDTGDLIPVLSRNMWNPIVTDGYVYFIDLESNYNLCRYNFMTDTIEILTRERVDLYNVYDNIIFYQTVAKEPALKRMNTDGSGQEIVRYGSYENINITSHYVYFNEFNASAPVYHTPTYGALNVTTFDNAKEAVLRTK